MFLLHYCIFTGGMLLRVGNFFSGSFFFPAFSPILLPPIIFLSTVVFRLLFSCFTRSSLPLSPLLLPHRFFIFPILFFLSFSSPYRSLRFRSLRFIFICSSPLLHSPFYSARVFRPLYALPDIKYRRIFPQLSAIRFLFAGSPLFLPAF